MAVWGLLSAGSPTTSGGNIRNTISIPTSLNVIIIVNIITLIYCGLMIDCEL